MHIENLQSFWSAGIKSNGLISSIWCNHIIKWIKLSLREDSTHGHYQMVNRQITLIILFAAKDGETVYKQQK